jgi:hypothetical protein
MIEREVVIQGRTWIMTNVPAPDYSKVKPSNLKFNLTYKYVPGLQSPPRPESVRESEEDR